MWANIDAIFSARKSLYGHSKCTKMQGLPIFFQGRPAYYIRGGGNPPPPFQTYPLTWLCCIKETLHLFICSIAMYLKYFFLLLIACNPTAQLSHYPPSRHQQNLLVVIIKWSHRKVAIVKRMLWSKDFFEKNSIFLLHYHYLN